jgi:hypothetical protein
MRGLVKKAYLEFLLIVEEESRIGWKVEERGDLSRTCFSSLTPMIWPLMRVLLFNLMLSGSGAIHKCEWRSKDTVMNGELSSITSLWEQNGQRLYVTIWSRSAFLLSDCLPSVTVRSFLSVVNRLKSVGGKTDALIF